MDQRHFATIKFVPSKKELDAKLKTIGPDMLNDPDMREIMGEMMRSMGKNNQIINMKSNIKFILII